MASRTHFLGETFQNYALIKQTTQKTKKFIYKKLKQSQEKRETKANAATSWY